MPKHNVFTTTASRPSKALLIEKNHLFERGLRDVKPKRLNYSKMVATLVRQVTCSCKPPIAKALLMTPPSSGEMEGLFDHLSDFTSITLSASSLPGLLEQVMRIDDRMVLAVAGEAIIPRDDAHSFLAKALVANSQRIEDKILGQLTETLKSDVARLSPHLLSARPSLVIQEKPGKFSTLNLIELTLRQQTRRWQMLLGRGTREFGQAPAWGVDGFGVGALVIDGKPDVAAKSDRTINIASMDIRFPFGVFDLNTGRLLAEEAQRWLSQLHGLHIRDLTRLIISAPAPVVSGYVASCFESVGARPDLQTTHPDLAWGWHPVLSCLEAMTSAVGPTLMVATGHFPLVHIIAIWKDGSP